MMRMANADLLPFDVGSFYKTVAEYATELKSSLETTRNETELQNIMISEKIFELAKDPTKVYQSPKMEEPIPYLDFSRLENALMQLKKSTEEFQRQYDRSRAVPSDKLLQVNEILYKAERSLLNDNGLPRRSWYKHEIYAPGYYTGYGVKTLPGIREAIEQRNWKEAQENIEIVSETISNYQTQVQQAIGITK